MSPIQKIKKNKKRLLTPLIAFMLIAMFLLTSNLVFQEQPVKAWADSNYSYRTTITISSTLTDNDLTDFPVMVKFWDNTSMHSKVQSDCYDIVFYADDDATQLAHEIEYADDTTNLDYVAWVNVTSVSSSSDTTIYCYYGYASATDTSNPSGVWDGNYLGVYHFNESSGSTCYDSTGNSNDATYSGSLPTVNTSVKCGYGQNFDGTGDYVSLPNGCWLDVASNEYGTIEVYANYWSIDSAQMIYIQDETTTDESQFLQIDATSKWKIYCYDDAAFQWLDNSNGAALGWQHLAISMYTNDVDLLLNGTGIVSDTSCNMPEENSGFKEAINVGADQAGNNEVTGTYDEFRISNVKRNASWIKASYHSINNTYLSFGDEETNELNECSLVLDNDEFTFQEELGNTSWANESGSIYETAEFNFSYNGTNQFDYIRINISDIDTNITASNISVQFSADNTTWGANSHTLSDGSNNIWVNSSQWTNNYFYGSDPFPIQDNLSIWMRMQVAIPAGIGTETYTTSSWTWDSGYYDT